MVKARYLGVFLLLLLLFPGSMTVAAGEPVSADVGDMVSWIHAAAEQSEIDCNSEVIQKFIQASNWYDSLDTKQQTEVLPETKAELELVRSRIQETIAVCDGVMAGSKTWYIQTCVSDLESTAELLEQIRSVYPGSAPEILYQKAIHYVDIRTGEACYHPGMIELSFPVPEGYDGLVNPKLFTWMDGELLELSAKRNADGYFVIPRARSLSNVIVADLPISLTEIRMDETLGINLGQSYTISLTVLPEQITQPYEIVWSSSDQKIVSVDQKGTVKGLKEGKATITASVKGQKGMTASCTVTVVQGAHVLSPSLQQVMKETKAYMLSLDTNPTVGSEWFVLGLARSGMDLDEEYFKIYYNHFANYLAEKKGILTNTVKYTEYSRAVLVMTAIGKDARNIAGYNLLKPLADFETVTAQGINGPIWALLALNSNPVYSIPKVSGVPVQTTEKRLVDYIVENECKNGGWNLLGDTGDSDLTGMALQALAPYYQKAGYEHVTAAVDRALDLLSRMQNTTGGYSTMGVETSESCVQVITGLCALGMDPAKDVRFIKGGNWTVENLFSYHISKSGFMHVKAGAENNGGGAAGTVNGMATEQAYYGMTAYYRLLNNQTSLYDMSDILLEKGQQGDGNGTGLEQGGTGTEQKPDQGNTASGEKPGQGAGETTKPGQGSVQATKPGSSPNNLNGQSGQNSFKVQGGTASGKEPVQTATQKKKAVQNEKKKKENAKKKDGWDFTAELYPEGTGWDFMPQSYDEELEVESAEAALADTDANMKRLDLTKSPDREIAMGIAAAAVIAIGGSVVLWRKRKKNKGLVENRKVEQE